MKPHTDNQTLIWAIVILSVVGVAAVVLLAIFAPTQATPVAMLLAFLGPTIVAIKNSVSIQEVKGVVNGRMTEVLGRLDQDKADQRIIGHSEGRAEEQAEHRLRSSGPPDGYGPYDDASPPPRGP